MVSQIGGYNPGGARSSSNPYGRGSAGALTYVEKPEDVEAREQGRVSGELSRMQQEAQQRIYEAQQQAQAAITQAQFQAQEQIGAKRQEVEATRMQRAQELAALEQRFAAEIEQIAAAGRTSPRVNPRTQMLPLPGVG